MIRSFLLCLCALWLTVTAAYADHPGQPAPGDVVLTVSGVIDHRHAVTFDREMLRALDWEEVQTFTKWTEGPQRFSGPRLSAVLEAVGARGVRLKAVALNDYTVEIPVTDAAAHHVILAIEHEGQTMGVRQKGPVWIIYPHGSQARAEASTFSHRMIWQMTHLMILN